MQKPNKFFLIGLAAVLILVLVLPQSAWASLIPGPFDYFDMVSQNIEEISSPIMSRVITTFMFYGLGLIVLNTTAHILDKVIAAQANWLDLKTVVVQEGWHFTTGLANMLIILILIFIAIQIILKIDTVATKKALIKLLIVALLLNFSLLFVEIALDVTDVFYNSILTSVKSMPGGGEGSLFGSVVSVLTGGKSRIVRNFTVMVGGWAVTSLIPGAGGIKQFIISLVFVAAYLPMIIGWMIETALFFVLAGMFLTFIFVFAARVYIIQILAILSPLAFICLILPQTEKYWKEWLNYLVQWVFCGIFLLFFLALWCAGINGAIPQELSNPWIAAVPFLSWKGITSQVILYFLMIVYLGVLLWVSKKAVPVMAQEIMGLAKNIGATVWSSGIKPLGGIVRQETRKTALESDRVRHWAERQSMVQTPQTGWKKIMSPGYALRRGLGRELGPKAVEAEQKTFDEAEKQFTGRLYDLKVSALLGEQSRTRRTGIISAFSEDGEMEKLLRDNKVKNVLTEEEKKLIAGKAGQVDRPNKVVKALLPKGTKKEQERWLEEIGVKEPEQWEKDAFKIKTRLDKVVGRVKPANIKYFSSEALAGEGAQEAIHEFWHGAHISQAALEFGKVFLDKFQEEANMRGIEWYQTHNPRMVKYFDSSPARTLGLEVPPKLVITTKPYVPPTSKSTPHIEEELAKQTIMKEDIVVLRKEYRKLLRKPPIARSLEEEEEIKMLEHTLEEFRKKLNK